MIARVRLVRFKRFDDESFDLSGDSVFLAGPNNSGKTSVLHALSSWDLVVRRWLVERGESASAGRRIGVVLDEFTALPLREMNLLWLNRHTARKVAGAPTPKAAPIYIEVEVASAQGAASLAVELLYANEKLVYVRPVQSPENPLTLKKLPDFARDLQVAHVPPFSGLGTQEPRHAAGMQRKLVGEGRAGEIVRNLLLEIWEKSDAKADRPPWSELASDIDRLFQYELLSPEFSPLHPHIVCEYRPKATPKSKGRGPRLDIANAGSGFHQVLLLLAFFHGRPASVLLLDEPDAHLHFILQREIMDHLRLVATRRRCQLVIATHAEVLFSSAEPDEIVSFVGPKPRRLIEARQKQVLATALRTLTSLDLLQATQVGSILYVEDESDYKLLREWAGVLGHPAFEFLSFPYVWPLHGRGNLDAARRHFECLRMAFPTFEGVGLVDRDLDPVGDPLGGPQGLKILRWQRREIESYLLHPEILKRYVDGVEPDLFGRADQRRDHEVIDERFAANFPHGIDWSSDLPVLRDIKASEFIVDVLGRTSRPLAKRDLYMLARKTRPEEVHPDVRAVLDLVAAMKPEVAPVVASNASVEDVGGVEGGRNDETD